MPEGRLERIDPSALVGSAADLYSRYATGERARPGVDFTLIDGDGQLMGPPATWMLSPDLGLGLERLGYGIRFELSLPARSREIVILMVAAVEDSPFERYAHHQAARRAGLTEAEIALLDAGSFAGRDEEEAVLVRVAKSVLVQRDLPDDLWESAVEVLGRPGVFEVVTLIGWYRMMALHLRIFRIEPPTSAAQGNA